MRLCAHGDEFASTVPFAVCDASSLNILQCVEHSVAHGGDGGESAVVDCVCGRQ